MERFEPKYWPRNPFDKAIILLDDTVEGFGLNDIDDPTNTRDSEEDV